MTMTTPERLRELLAADNAWRCTGDAMRCADGNGCECEMKGVGRPDLATAMHEALPALLHQLAELEAARDAAADLDNEDRRDDAEFWWTVAAFRAREMAGALTEAKRSQEEWLSLKDQYSELARTIGCEGDAWFGDPLESHEAVIAKAKAAERARDEATGLLREVIERDRVKHLNNECGCINHSRAAEREYDAGKCPHQRIAAFLAASGGK